MNLGWVWQARFLPAEMAMVQVLAVEQAPALVGPARALVVLVRVAEIRLLLGRVKEPAAARVQLIRAQR